MATEERARSCRNCGRNQPESLLNKEGRCQTCGPSDTPDTTRDPKEHGTHGEPKRRATKEKDAEGEDTVADAGKDAEGEDQG